MNWGVLKNPSNWVVVWTMLLIGWFLFRTIKNGISFVNSNEDN